MRKFLQVFNNITFSLIGPEISITHSSIRKSFRKVLAIARIVTNIFRVSLTLQFLKSCCAITSLSLAQKYTQFSTLKITLKAHSPV